MRKLHRIVIAVLVAAPLVATLAAADSKAVQAMAGILMKLNHFPSDAEKATLKAIVDDKNSTAGERTVAQALMNVMHKVSAADKPKLEALVSDKDTSDALKTIAKVILNLNHTPTDAEKEQLKKIAS
jgi:hypothetical protein